MINTRDLAAMSLLALIAFSACNTDPGPDTPEPGIDIEFSDSPFEITDAEAQFAADIEYDSKERTVFDIWLPTADSPTPIVIYAHGGGFTGGDKSNVHEGTGLTEEINTLLANGIAFASINYTLLAQDGTEDVGVIGALNDVKRAVQYIRSRASDFNIDKTKIIMAGGSAGAGSALWIATNDDMADSGNEDPVLQESTRLSGVVLAETQCTYDIGRWETDVFVEYSLSIDAIVAAVPAIEGTISAFYGMASYSEFNSAEIVAYRAQVDMLDLLTADDPEIWVDNTVQEVVPPINLGILYHHAYHAEQLKLKAEAVGVPVVAYYGKDGALFSDASNEGWVDFAIRKFSE